MRGKSGDPRFVERVLAPAERDVVERAAEPDLELWAAWAAKEAAYKVVSKLRGAPLVFIHAAYVASWSGPVRDVEPGASALTGIVSHEGESLPVTLARGEECLHVVAGEPGWDGGVDVTAGTSLLDEPAAPWSRAFEELLPRFSERELDAVRTRASAAVRIGAKAALSDTLGVDASRVEIVCGPGQPGRRPPVVFLDGSAAADADVSLSHHGRWIAWAVWTRGATAASLT